MGAIGNQNAVRGKRWREALRRALARRCGSVESGLDALADMRVKAAFAGDKEAIDDIANREDGKPAQAIIGDADSDPVGVAVTGTIKLVRPDGS